MPVKASVSLSGEISSRAHQFCTPFLVANSMGYLIYPPIDFNILFDGVTTYVQLEGMDEWIILDKIFLPDFIDIWKKNIPEELKTSAPVFLEAFPERAVLQLWTGYFVDTLPGYNLWIRSPINRNHSASYKVIEGVVENDWWAGPLFTNIEILKTDIPISFKKDQPFLQVIMLPRKDLERSNSLSVTDIEDGLPDQYIQRMIETSDRRNTQRPGSYRRFSSKREDKNE